MQQMDCAKVKLNVGHSSGINPEIVKADQPLRDSGAGWAMLTPFEAGTGTVSPRNGFEVVHGFSHQIEKVYSIPNHCQLATFASRI
jgi:hypothetical protein